MEWTNSHYYYILASLFGIVFPIIWEKGIRPKIFSILEQSTLVESERLKNRILGQIHWRYRVITFGLIGLGIIFGFMGLF